MESAVKHQFDKELELQAFDSAAVTSDTASTKRVDLNRLTKGRGDVKNRYGQGSFDIVAYVKSIDATSGSETYELQVRTTDANGANPVVQAVKTITAAEVGTPLVFKFDVDTLKASDADAAKVEVFANVGGATPSIAYWAYAAPNSRQ